jgi:hypothetical protein
MGRKHTDQPSWFDDTYRGTEVTYRDKHRPQLQFRGFGRLGRQYTLTVYRDSLDSNNWTVECRTNNQPRKYYSFSADELRKAFGIGRRPYVDDPLARAFNASFIEQGKYARRGHFLVIPGPENTADLEWPAHRSAVAIKIKRWHKELLEELIASSS